ncbi:hypothetical protein GCM10010251_27260 [Streptomyces aurantiogriseus]|uniref:Uncharacterized protein n=1 Tax=Streptomyces aurantiogriseus TaxID=66870 RepID=A0A918C8E5_9ACTN|nr:hypothetical protein GCM10010251_27260 [Streptomyces aurantiogriseus]
MHWETVHKDTAPIVPPRLTDYDRRGSAFAWSQARAALAGLPGGGLNMAYEAVDRHTASDHADKVALRCIARDDSVSTVTYEKLARRTARFANAPRRTRKPGPRRDPPPRHRHLPDHVRRFTAQGSRGGGRTGRRGHQRRGDRPAHAASPGRRGRHRFGGPNASCGGHRRGMADGKPRRRGVRAHRRESFYDLDAPVERVCSAEVPMPYARRLEEAALPQVADIVAAAHRAVD